MVSSIESSVGTERKVVTELPDPSRGPARASQGRRERRAHHGLSHLHRAGRGRHRRRRRRQPHLGPGLGHRGDHHWPRRARGDRGRERPGRRVHPHLLHGRALRELRDGLRGVGRAHPGTHAKASALFNSGSEAVENAVKVARLETGREAIVVFDHAYHGRTNLTMALTAKNMPYKDRFGPFAPEIYRVAMSYPFRTVAAEPTPRPWRSPRSRPRSAPTTSPPC